MSGRRAFGVVLVLMASVTACGESESQSESSNDAEGGRGGSVGGSGGQSGTGNGGASGAGGAGAIGGTSGTSGTSGMPTDDPDEIARAAVVLGSCYPDDGVSRNASELWHWREEGAFWRGFHVVAECIAEAGGGCDALEACLGWTLAESPGCTPGRTCDGSVFRYCIERPGYENIEQTLDCGTIDLECDAGALCIEPPAVACDDATFVGSCEANRPLACPSTGVVRPGPDCAELGLACVADDAQNFGARCVGTGDACTSLSDPLFDGMACAGSTLVACVNGRQNDLDCATMGEGFSCQTNTGIPFCGIASECLPANLQGAADRDVPQGGLPEPACEGNTIVFCNAGRLERIDCTTLGFTGCDLDAGIGCVPSPTSDLNP